MGATVSKRLKGNGRDKWYMGGGGAYLVDIIPEIYRYTCADNLMIHNDSS